MVTSQSASGGNSLRPTTACLVFVLLLFCGLNIIRLQINITAGYNKLRLSDSVSSPIDVTVSVQHEKSENSDNILGPNEQETNDHNQENSNKTEETTSREDHRRMNVLVLYPDDWRHNSVGKENPLIKTPFLDSLADSGIRFRQNAVTTSICWSSRATYFTGQWLSRHQSYRLRCPHFARNRRWNQTWPAMLQNDGYYVGHVGKWHYYSDNKGRFDWSRFHEGHHWNWKRGRGNIAVSDITKEDAIDFLRERPKDKPFALTVAFYPPKAVGISKEPGGQWMPKRDVRALYDNLTIPEPYNMTHSFSLLPPFLQDAKTAARAKWKERYLTSYHYQEAMKNIYALITQVDSACEKIVDELKAQGLYNNTMVIFTTDNGMFHGAHGLDGKWYPYQESIRVPLIIYDPRMPADKVGTLDDHFTLNVDLAETILGAARLKPHHRMQGRDISDLYLPNKRKNGKTALKKKPWRKEFFYEFDLLDDHEHLPPSNALVRRKWKYIDWYEHNYTQLFDLKNDPLELTDVADYLGNAPIIEKMEERLFEMQTEFQVPMREHLECEKKGDQYWSALAEDNSKQ